AVPKKYHYRTIITGTPVRGSLRTLTSGEGRKSLSIKPEEKVLLVNGGSQGAQQINEAILQILARLVQDFTVIHITGEAHLESIKAVTSELLGQSARREAYKPYGYLADQMPFALACANGIVSRAGSSIIEQIALRKPMLLIPLATAASDHQRANARVLEASGSALVLEPTNIGSHLLEQNIRQLMNDETLRNKLIENMAALDFPKAGPDMAELAFSLARGLAPGKAAVSTK
ncbi:MAG TPA: UDP-N-acetylglucosamine--N-acetylmuramyl-(pentapeptide) pyrophosphoryl-undecaprenol N-acetylglucosamine transferase, partial [Methylophilaceae bacterium]|nr:UDP-N-acetylglucosamine--N-acetylmuramyl-(pentapeptide) pyrophosphoryl-undecaprenol N-acetylglucosamine transferase [Methylophilaceae bacterium]